MNIPRRLLSFVMCGLAVCAYGETANVALRGIATANAPLYNNANIARLIDGDTQTVFHGDVAPPDGFAYAVDLGKDYPITEINLFPRQDGCCPERLSNVRVSVHSDESGQMGAEVWGTNLFTNGDNAPSTNGTRVQVTLPSAQTGRWVEIRALASPVPDYSLQLTEMQVLATVPASDVNRAVGAVASANQALWPGTSAANLVNGSRGDFVHGVAGLANGFAYTINLGVEVDISRIVIIPRQDGCCPERLTNYRVSIHKNANGSPGPSVWSADLHTDGSNIGAEPGAAEVITKDLNASGEFKGQFVRIESLEDPVQDYALQIGEVEVYGTAGEGVSVLIAKDLESEIAVGVGQPATLSIGVNVINGSTNSLSYQWQSGGVDIPGATNSIYTTGAHLSTDSGKKYRVKISYPGQADIMSKEATVQINYAYHADTFSNQILWTGGGWTIDKLVNGDRSDVFHGDVDIPAGFAYQAKIPAPVKFDSIVIFPRQDGCCPERLTNFRVSIHNDNNGAIGAPVWSADLFTDGTNPGATGGVKVVLTNALDPNGTFEGQWIQIQSLEDPVQNYALQMTELEAYGTLLENVTRLGISQFPTNVLAAPGRSSTLTVVPNLFNGDVAKLTYRWKKNGEFVPGATNATFSTGPLTDADASARYRVVLSYPGVADVESAEASVQFDYNYARGAKPYTNQPLWVPGNWNISMLVDGNRRGVFHGHTGLQPGFAYTVDLGGVVNLEKINIYPRQDGCCPDRLSNFRVSVHNDDNGAIGQEVWSADLFTDGSDPGSGEGALVTVEADLDPEGVFKGQWIKVQALSDPVPDYNLQMTELEAIGRIEASTVLSLTIARSPTGSVVTWADGTLETTTNLGDAWTPVANATSPYPVPTSESRRFYRLKK